MQKFAWKNLKSRPVRSTLAVIGMAVAIMGMVGLFSIAEGLDNVVSNTLNRVPGLVAMQRGAPIPLFSKLPAAWQEELEALPGVSVVCPECWDRANVIDGKVIVSPPRLLCGTDIIRRNRLKTAVYRDDMTDGRFLNEEDLNTLNCIVSQQIADEFEKGVGDTLEIHGYPLQIVGIYYTGSMLLDVAIIIDVNQFRQMTRFEPNTVSSFYIEQDGTVDDDSLLASIQNQFRGRGPGQWSGSLFMGMGTSGNSNPISSFLKGINQAIKGENPPAPKAPISSQAQSQTPDKNDPESTVDDDPMEVRLASDWASRFDKFSSDLDIALLLLTSLGMTIAVVSIINTMLMSVTERIVEFGILRANGWSQTDIVKLITWESFILGMIGGLLGCLLGWIGTQIVNATFPTKIQLYASPSLLLFGLIFSGALGIVGGLYPAFWASRRSPMEAIRRG